MAEKKRKKENKKRKKRKKQQKNNKKTPKQTNKKQRNIRIIISSNFNLSHISHFLCVLCEYTITYKDPLALSLPPTAKIRKLVLTL